MSFFFRTLLLVFVSGLFSAQVYALNVHGVYRTACERVLGVIMRVDKRSVHLMDLDGRMVAIPRHEIVSLAYYPVTRFPLEAIHVDSVLQPLIVQAIVAGKLVDLVEGWPIDYSEQKIAFLQRNGSELVIQRSGIWALRFVERPPLSVPNTTVSQTDRFVHPQSVGFCQAVGGAALPSATVPSGGPSYIPQQWLNDEVVIKKEFDRLQQGYEEILEDNRDQKYYPIPQLFQTRTSLGLWLSAGNRHGASSHRTNFTPLIANEVSLGPFRYQHLFQTGSAPNNFFVHEEPQTQIYYRFKAAYFHASTMVDPGLVLVGKKYFWQEEELRGSTVDDRVNDTFITELGFDFGPLAIEFSPLSVVSWGVKAGDYTGGLGIEGGGDPMLLMRGGAKLTFRTIEAELFGGLTVVNERAGLNLLRFNLGLNSTGAIGLAFSFIYRGMAIYPRDRNIYTSQQGPSNYDYTSSTLTNMLRLTWTLSRRWSLEGYVSLEHRSSEFNIKGIGGTDSAWYPKAGVATFFTF